jgi:hypothetical protein
MVCFIVIPFGGASKAKVTHFARFFIAITRHRNRGV